MADLRTYSVVIAWNDRQRDEGTFGDTVRARDPMHAERIVRARMMRAQWDEWSRIDKGMSKRDVADMYASETVDGVEYFGTCHECSEGAIWKAKELETALRSMRAAYGRLHDFMSDAIEGGRLTRGHLPDDYDAIADQLEACATADAGAEAVLKEIDGM